MTEYFIRKYNNRIDAAYDNLAKFQEKLAADPLHALDWSYSVFKIQAHAAIYREVVGMLKNGVSLEKVCRKATQEALRAARNPAHSTSPTSNIVEQEKAAAWSEVAEDVQIELDNA